MIHYHGVPLNPEHAAASVYAGRHAMVSFSDPLHLPLVADICQSFALDNGAYSAWRSGAPITDWEPYADFVGKWMAHPGFDWFLIPDVIDGTEIENDKLIRRFRKLRYAVPVWHMHESIGRLEGLCSEFDRVALGSSGEFAEVGTRKWWSRMADAMNAVCDEEGRPAAKFHGLRMLDPRIFTELPLASADSTNAARNVGQDGKWRGPYEPAGKAARGIVLAGRIEAQNSASHWRGHTYQELFQF